MAKSKHKIKNFKPKVNVDTKIKISQEKEDFILINVKKDLIKTLYIACLIIFLLLGAYLMLNNTFF
jgi:hypothetical protein